MNDAYENSFKLFMGETTYEKLSEENDGMFLLLTNHEDPAALLEHYINVEDYEKCSQIRDKINPNKDEYTREQ